MGVLWGSYRAPPGGPRQEYGGLRDVPFADGWLVVAPHDCRSTGRWTVRGEALGGHAPCTVMRLRRPAYRRKLYGLGYRYTLTLGDEGARRVERLLLSGRAIGWAVALRHGTERVYGCLQHPGESGDSGD